MLLITHRAVGAARHGQRAVLIVKGRLPSGRTPQCAPRKVSLHDTARPKAKRLALLEEPLVADHSLPAQRFEAYVGMTD